MINFKKKINELREDGITILENEFSIKQCDEYIEQFEKILTKLRSVNSKLNRDCQLILNPYRQDIELANLVYNKNVDTILKELIDEDYVMINSTIVNRKIDESVNNEGFNMGDLWHTDSQYVGGVRLDKGYSFIAVILFDDFTEENAATFYIPKSHLRREKPNREGYESEAVRMTGKRGSIILFDGGMWHKGGTPTHKRRWSTFTYYGPWFAKPYYRFPEMLGEDFGKKTTKELRRLFHYNSTPPLNEDIRTNTVVKE